MKRRRLISPLLLSIVLLTGCTDADLTTVAKALNDTAQSVGVLQTAVISANNDKLISDQVTRQILTEVVRVNQAGRQAVAITRGINALKPADRTTLLAILNPVIASLADTQSSIAVGITNSKTQMDVQAIIGLIQASLNTAQLALASKGQ